MDDALNIDHAESYEAPLLAKVGDFASATQGLGSEIPEGEGYYTFV